MKISLSWLRRYVDVGLEPEELAEALTMAGVEVASIERRRLKPEGPEEVILDLDLTPNRADCLSHIGVAREVAAITGAPVVLPAFELREEPPATESLTSIEIEDPQGCPRYVGRIIRDVTVGPSPQWLQEALLAIGLRPINNVVDATNFVLFEWGQPLHAFDFDKLEGRKIIVRRARAGERIVTIDGQDRALEPSMLVIADAERPVAVAGVMGGEATEVTEATRTVLLESAYFDPVTVRRCAKRLKLPTESSHRFERGVDPEAVLTASARAAALIAELAGGKVSLEALDIYPRPILRPTVTLRVSRTNAVLGTELSAEAMARYCQRLGLSLLEPEDEEVLAFRIPSHRGDLEREVDLMEEVARLHGFHQIPATLPASRTEAQAPPESLKWSRQIKQCLTGMGLSEAITYSFISAEDLKRCRLGPDHPLAQTIPLKNPLSAEMALMRTSLLPSLLRACAFNVSRRVESYRVFELSVVFVPDPGETRARELPRLAALLFGPAEETVWSEEAEPPDFFEAKGIVEALCQALRVPVEEWKEARHPTFHPRRSAEPASQGLRLGVVGEIHPEVLKAFELPGPVAALELDLDALRQAQRPQVTFQPLPRYPAVYRDLAVVVDEEVPAAEVERVIRQAAGQHLESLRLFDLYTGAPIPQGKKSLAFSLAFRARDRTLTDQEASAIHEAIVERLQKTFQAELRT